MIDVLNEMLHPETLPLLKFNRRAFYEGSIDKVGGNADWDWQLYQDERGEWVLFEQYGPGCVFNFVQHRYLASEEPIFHFYFDDDVEPRFSIKPSQFGEKYPFVEPLCGKFISPRDNRPTIRVVRSFVPMPFSRYCRITSSIQLLGNDVGGGGWGHVVCHRYTGEGVEKAFDPEDPRYRELERLWSQIGRPPYRPADAQTVHQSAFSLAPGEEKAIFDVRGEGCISALRIRTDGYSQEDLHSLWLHMRWDDHPQWDVSLPFGALFGNELGYHPVQYLYLGMDADGGYSLYFPMPFKKSAQIVVSCRGGAGAAIAHTAVTYTKDASLYQDGTFGYFRASHYYPKTPTHNADSVIASLAPCSGHVVSAIITGYPWERQRADCEGDVRVHFDGLRTPSIESDGSESYICYGWGFCSPPQTNPVSGYDGKSFDIHEDWSMVRTMPGDCYPFLHQLQFGIESFGYNELNMCHSGAVFYYGAEHSRMKLIGEYTAGTQELTSTFEGEDQTPFTLHGTRGEEILISLPAVDADEIILHRVSDQLVGRQYADVLVNGVCCDMPWYFPDSNPHRRWLEDEYRIPKAYFAGSDAVEIKIVPRECGGKTAFNQFGVKIYQVNY